MSVRVVRWVLGSLASLVVAAPARASADDLKTGVGAAFTGSFGAAVLDRDLRAGSQEPDMLASRTPHVDSRGAFGGGGVRVVAVFDRWRVTFEEAVFGLGGAKYRLDGAPLPTGFSTSATSLWGANFELSFGRHFDVGVRGLAPYADLRVGLALTSVGVDLHSAQYGFLGTTAYPSGHLILAPRVGAIYRVGRAGFVDVGASYDVTGPERMGVSFALGIWLAGPEIAGRYGRSWL